MVSNGSMKRTMGVEPDGAPIARRSCSSLGGGGVNSMQPSLPTGGDYRYTMQCFGDLLGDPMMAQFLQPGVLKSVRQEFDKNRSMLDDLDGDNGCKCPGCISTPMKKDPAQVEYAAGVVYDWLSDEGGSVLGFLQVLSIHGLPYSDKFSDSVHRCANGIKAMTMTKVAYQIAMVARLCRADSVGGSSLVLEDCAPTEIDYEGDGDGKIDIEDDERSEHPQDIHNFHVDLLYAPHIDTDDDESSEHPQDIHNFHVDLLYAEITDDSSDEFARASVVDGVV